MSDEETTMVEVVKSKLGKALKNSHPLKSGLSGMEDFSYIYFLTRGQGPQWMVDHVLKEIDILLSQTEDCVSCHNKLLAFAIRFCEEPLPERGKEYKALYDQARAHPDRDYLAEVNEQIKRFRKNYKENAWRYEIKLSEPMFQKSPPARQKQKFQTNLF